MASSTEIRKLFKAFKDDPQLHAAVRNAQSPEEKHAIIRKAGYTPVNHEELKSELAKALHPAGGSATPADDEFVGNVLHLAASNATDFA